MWHSLDRDGIDIGRELTARLMRLAGVSGKGTGGSPITTRKANVPDLRPDVVEREFKAQGPNKLWVADITYVRTRKGFVYTAFVTDVYSRRIVGWALSDFMRTSGPDPRKVDTSGASYAAVVSIAEVLVSKTSGATRLHQEWRLRVL